MRPSPPPLFIVVSGPSGVGKDALLKTMRERGNPLHFVVTATTRPPRAGERDGVDYLFCSREGFIQLIEEGELLEWAEVYGKGHFYGVPRAAVRAGLENGKDTIVRTDIQGAATIRSKVPHAVLVFLVPPSKDTLEEQLRQRATDSEESIRRRLEAADAEMRSLSNFDYAIVNEHGKLDATAAILEAVITAERHRARPRLAVV